MGNRAVLTTKENYLNDGIGIYLHWNGGQNSIEAFCYYCDAMGYRTPDSDDYGFARLIQTIANFFGPNGLSIGVGKARHLDDSDNGTWFIKDWRVAENSYTNEEGRELKPYYTKLNSDELIEFMCAINVTQPILGQLGEDSIREYVNSLFDNA